MSWRHKRERKRRAQREELRSEFDSKRGNPEAFTAMLQRLAKTDVPIWAIARLASSKLDETETAMIAQVVAPKLACMTPGNVHERHKLGE